MESTSVVQETKDPEKRYKSLSKGFSAPWDYIMCGPRNNHTLSLYTAKENAKTYLHI